MLGSHLELFVHAELPDAHGPFSWSADLEGGEDITNIRGCFYRQGKTWTTAELHPDSTCSESLDTVVFQCKAFCCCPAYVFSVARPTISSAAVPLAETIHVSAPLEPKTDCICLVAI